MYSPRIMQKFTEFASGDMRLARKEGRIIISTKNMGRAILSYADGIYKLTDYYTDAVLFEGKIKKDRREALINLYEVVT